jgi:hypothetical protein
MSAPGDQWNDAEIDRLVQSSLNVEPSPSFLSRVRAAVAETTVDQEIQDALNIEPSPEFVARVRTRLAEETPVRVFAWPRWLFASGAVAALLVAAVALLMVRTPEVTVARRSAEPALPLSALRQTDPGTPDPESRASEPRALETRAPGSRVAEPPRRPSTDLEVIVSRDEVRAFRQYLTSLDPDAYKTATVLEADPVMAPLSAVDHLAIEPIVVAPLDISTE